MLTLDDMRKEMLLARKRILLGVGMAEGRDWRLAIEKVGDEQERHVVGVEDSRGSMVMGDCMSDPNNEVTVGDARFIAMFDPIVMMWFAHLLGHSAELNEESNAFSAAYEISRQVNAKWAESEKALNGEER